MKKTLNTLLYILCAGFLLTACSYFDTGEFVANGQQQPAENTDQSAAVVQFHSPDIMEMAGRARDPGVSVFSLDGEVSSASVYAAPRLNAVEKKVPVAKVLPFALKAPEQSGGGYYNDPSVEVFPFDGTTPTLKSGTPAILPFTPKIASAAAVSLRSPPSFGMEGRAEEKLYFAHDSTTLSPSDEAALAGFSKDRPVKVTGYSSMKASYSDPVQRQIANLKVSMDRAFEVTKTLIENGVPAEMIETSAWGEVHPAPATEQMDSEAASRRVEITPR